MSSISWNLIESGYGFNELYFNSPQNLQQKTQNQCFDNKIEITLILRKYKPKTVVLLKQKDEEIAKAMNRAMELEDFLRKMEIKNQTWQRVAKENESVVVSLNSTIKQLRENKCLANGIEDTESCCDVMIYRGDNETGENRGYEKNQQENEEHSKRKMVCKSCNSLNSCVIFLPCRHLCS
ncbi:putative BOI-related E3 ubiquitin-protein ligase 3 [Camellia lanceoleosa]|nr:putative BOI-related E3 ubiquitin-protein ligase 3 [Camellia lanceoleosa]